MPKISVLMPVYNTQEDYLREAISSILNQTYSDFEFIIINDGSTNNAKEVILSYQDERIKYYENSKNLGVIKTLNKGLVLADGEYIARMDSDDISNPKRLEISLNFMEENPDVGAAGCHAVATPLKYKYATPCQNETITPFLRYIANCMMHPTMIIRKSILEEHNLRYDANYIHCEDYKLWIEMDKHSRLANIPKVLLTHRIYDNAVSVKYAELQQYIADKILWENLLEEYGSRNIFLKKVVDKYFSKQKISVFDFCVILSIIKKIDKKLRKELTPDFYSYIENTYRRNFINYLKVSPANLVIIFIIWASNIMKILGYDEDTKKQLIKRILIMSKKK